jgi:putative peptide zinc metalloprotease protein
VRLHTRAVEIRLPQDLGTRWPAQLARSTPSAAKTLPSAVLGQTGGGAIAVDPRDPQGMTTIESVFEFELELPAGLPHRYLGSRVHVRFEHPAEPVGGRVWRAVRRGFLSTFEV